MLDDPYRTKLDQRKYVSLSHDRRSPPAPESDAPKNTALEPIPTQDEKDKQTIKSRAEISTDDKDLELDEEDSGNDDAEMPEGSLFDYNVPGIMSKEEVSKLDLAHWKLLVRTSMVELEVSYPTYHASFADVC